VVTDLGIAKALVAAKTPAPGGTLTQVGTSLGTPTYVAPEQAAGDPAPDHRADLYALGCVAYEMLAGEAPFARGRRTSSSPRSSPGRRPRSPCGAPTCRPRSRRSTRCATSPPVRVR
jgi:serine/threonine protein kinase